MLQPYNFDLGVVYEDAVIEGSFQVHQATELRKIATSHGQELVQLTGHYQASTSLVCTFRLNRRPPGSYCQILAIGTDKGDFSQQFFAEIRKGPAPGGKILFCSSPFRAVATDDCLANLSLLTRELEVEVHAFDDFPDNLAAFDVIVLNGAGLRFLVERPVDWFNAALEQGTRLVLLADQFQRESTMLANHLSELWGLRFEEREYHEVLCGVDTIAPHPVTAGITRLRWFRPSPITVHGQGELLVRNPTHPSEGFAACSGPRGNLFALGMSQPGCLLCVGWPFQNGQLFANLLEYQRAFAVPK